jgi:hypothetical protein
VVEGPEVVELDLQEAAAEGLIGVPAEEVPPAESFESRERLVAAEPVAEDAVSEEPASERTLASPVDRSGPAPVVPAHAAPPNESRPVAAPPPVEALEQAEEVEAAPLSSRRPVAAEPEERLADMAFGAEEPPPRHTPPPESGRLPAAPDVEFDPDVTGVRPSTPITVVEPAARTRELVPEATRVTLGPNDAVADVVGDAQRFAPATFAALLDASLAL